MQNNLPFIETLHYHNSISFIMYLISYNELRVLYKCSAGALPHQWCLSQSINQCVKAQLTGSLTSLHGGASHVV